MQRHESIWGVANPMPVPQVVAPTGDVTLTAGAEVLIATSTALVAPMGGSCYPFAQGVIAILCGATAPTALQLAMRFNVGSDIATFVVAPALLVALATILVPFWFVGANSGSSFAGAGKIIEITGKATTNDATANQVGSRAFIGLAMGPDA